jgi:5'-3' exonuclease
VGDKTAAALVRTFGSVEAIREAIDKGHGGFPAGARAKLEAARDYLAVAPTVVRVATDAPVPEVDGSLPVSPVDPGMLADLDARFGLGSSLRRAVAALSGD